MNAANPMDNGSNNARIANKASYMDLFDRLEDPIFLIDPDTLEILDYNHRCEVYFNLTDKEVLKLEIVSFFTTEEEQENFRKDVRRSKRRYSPQKINVSWIINSENKHLEIQLCPLDLQDGNKVIQVLLKDVTEKVNAQKKLEMQNEALDIANKKLEELSVTDELTKLFNVRHYNNAIKLEHERAERHGSKYSIILFDVDNFKNYNDKNGHIAGDKLLKELAEVIKASVRNIDIPARYGGEEFIVICPETDSKQAHVVAERIRKAVEGHDFEHKEKQPLKCVSVSVGISTYRESTGVNPHELKKLADEALYSAKNNGRNRTVFK